MLHVQTAVVVAIQQTLSQLKRTAHVDLSELTVEDAFYHDFSRDVQRQLDPQWHRLSSGTKQLSGDLKCQKKLLEYLLRYDAVTLYEYLLAVRRASSQQENPSLWLTLEAADRLFKYAKERVYTCVFRAAARSTTATTPIASAATPARQCGYFCLLTHLASSQVPPARHAGRACACRRRGGAHAAGRVDRARAGAQPEVADLGNGAGRDPR